MKNILLATGFIIFASVSFSCKKTEPVNNSGTLPIPVSPNQNDPAEYIEITITGFPSTNGRARIALYNSSSSFNKPEEAFLEVETAVSGNSITIKLDSIPPGQYAFGVFHDENNNQEIDQNLFGIPTEGFAFSNNAMGTFGPPSYSQCEFTLAEKGFIAQTVSLRFY
jgi:uncharacterized protein (DUF2141 family)